MKRTVADAGLTEPSAQRKPKKNKEPESRTSSYEFATVEALEEGELRSLSEIEKEDDDSKYVCSKATILGLIDTPARMMFQKVLSPVVRKSFFPKESLEEKLRKMDNKLEELSKGNVELRDEVKQLQTDNVDLRKKVNELRADNVNLRNEVEEMKVELSKLATVVNDSVKKFLPA